MNGSVSCGDCFGGDEDASERKISGTTALILPLSPTVRDAMNYIIRANPKRIFSFSLPENDECELFRVCEKYLINQLGRGFKTLDFYNRVKTM
jgi:DNA repair protein RecO (recombination protein O)